MQAGKSQRPQRRHQVACAIRAWRPSAYLQPQPLSPEPSRQNVRRITGPASRAGEFPGGKQNRSGTSVRPARRQSRTGKGEPQPPDNTPYHGVHPSKRDKYIVDPNPNRNSTHPQHDQRLCSAAARRSDGAGRKRRVGAGGGGEMANTNARRAAGPGPPQSRREHRASFASARHPTLPDSFSLPLRHAARRRPAGRQT
jgi:hypothetical protein